MNTANLQLEGLYLAIASFNGTLIANGVVTVEEVDTAVLSAEQAALGDYRMAENLTPSQREAVAFPARLLRMANNGSTGSETQTFSELAKMVGELNRGIDAPEPDAPDSDGTVFYESQNGDKWLFITDTGGRQFVRHIPNWSSGGAVELTDLQSFLNREPRSPQNQTLETLLSKR